MKISDSELISRLKNRVEAEDAAVTDILFYMQEVKARKLDLARGYASMYIFMREEFDLDRKLAYAKVRAAELLDVDPSVGELLKQKKLTQTSMMQIQVAFLKHGKLDTKAKLAVIEKVVSSTKGTLRTLADCFPNLKVDYESTKPLPNDLTQITFAATIEQMAKFQELKDKHAHKNFGGRWDKLFEMLADMALKEPKPRKPKQGTQADKRTVHADRQKVPVQVERQKRSQAHHRCQFVSAEGKRCNETHGLQIEHVVPVALGGTNAIANLEILCSAHNRYRAWKLGFKKPEKPLDTAPKSR